MNDTHQILKTYHIRLGFVEVCVEARNVGEALSLGRRKLATEMPRLYDIIRTLEPSRFNIKRAA